MIDQVAAALSARAYADRKGRPAWREGSIEVDRVTVGGRDCWRVRADDVARPGEPDWAFEYDGGQSYLVDTASGECVGVGLMGGHALFGAGKD